jgi:hypothetical protein
MNNVRLNHFILWCKGWYQPINDRREMLKEAQQILCLDGYLECNNTISIVLNYIDVLVEKGEIKPIRLDLWNNEIVKYMNWYKLDYQTSLIYRLRNFFAFEVDAKLFNLTPPIYSRKLFKMGFVAPSHFGNSYKMCNHKVTQIWAKKSK